MTTLLPLLDEHIGHGVVSLQGIPMIGAVVRIVTSGFEDLLIVDDHPDIPGKPLIGIVAHQTDLGALTQKTIDLPQQSSAAENHPSQHNRRSLASLEYDKREGTK
jgi:hypothetical protein